MPPAVPAHPRPFPATLPAARNKELRAVPLRVEEIVAVMRQVGMGAPVVWFRPR